MTNQSWCQLFSSFKIYRTMAFRPRSGDPSSRRLKSSFNHLNLPMVPKVITAATGEDVAGVQIVVAVAAEAVLSTGPMMQILPKAKETVLGTAKPMGGIGSDNVLLRIAIALDLEEVDACNQRRSCSIRVYHQTTSRYSAERSSLAAQMARSRRFSRSSNASAKCRLASLIATSAMPLSR